MTPLNIENKQEIVIYDKPKESPLQPNTCLNCQSVRAKFTYKLGKKLVKSRQPISLRTSTHIYIYKIYTIYITRYIINILLTWQCFDSNNSNEIEFYTSSLWFKKITIGSPQNWANIKQNAMRYRDRRRVRDCEGWEIQWEIKTAVNTERILRISTLSATHYTWIYLCNQRLQRSEFYSMQAKIIEITTLGSAFVASFANRTTNSN